MEIIEVFDFYTIPLDEWIARFIEWLVATAGPFFRAIKEPIAWLLDAIDRALQAVPDLLMLALIFAVAYAVAGVRVAAFSFVAMLFVGFLGVWEVTMTSLAMVTTAVLICIVLGVPLGVLAARSDLFETLLRPALDAMQTTPSFVYLIPVVMLFGIGTVAGVIATIVFAIPPIIRLTSLGIRQVDREVVEAAYAFGSTPWQVLREVQFPLALRTVMAGLNQTLMLALSMIVIASLIGAGGLGQPVRQGINNLQPGVGFVGGIAIVLLAIVLDRITQALGPRAT